MITAITNGAIVDRYHTSGTAIQQVGWKVLDLAPRKKDTNPDAPPSLPPNLEKDQAQDVTCGIGFRLENIGWVALPWVKQMFYDKATKADPTVAQLEADYRAAEGLFRTKDNLLEYGRICGCHMYPNKVYERMALKLRDEKLPALLRSCPEFSDFENFPAAAQVFSLSFAYGRIPFDFPLMRAAVAAQEWAKAGSQCHQRGCSEAKNAGHVQLLQFAQNVKDKGLDPDSLPAGIV